ncbi:MAG: AAA family ATPase [Desulfosarcinaceae bacterium]
MIVICPNCQTRYTLDDKTVEGPNFFARCAKCAHMFTAYRPVRIQEVAFIDLEAARKPWADNNIIAISNQKGGVAKTSTCLNLGLSLAMQGKRVLVMDFDVQANLTISLGYQETASFYDVLNGGNKTFSGMTLSTKYENLWLFPSNKNMVLLNKKYFGSQNFEFILKDRLKQIKDDYDYILIDTPPSIEFFTLNALTAAGSVIIPSQCDYLSTHGIDQIIKLIGLIKAKSNPLIESRIFIIMFDNQCTAS